MSSDNRAHGGACEFMAELEEFLAHVRGILLDLQNEPDEATVEAALKALERIRNTMDQAKMFRSTAMVLRDKLIAHVAEGAPSLTMQTIAQAGGVGDSYASRVTRAYGAARRAKKWEAFRRALDEGETAERAARRLGLSTSTLRRYIDRLALETASATRRR